LPEGARGAQRQRTSSHHRDRFWFKSVYFKEPGGVLFEIATEGPGFAVDEDPAHLGETLVLPPWLEPYRAQIQNQLPRLNAPVLA
jgi:glyoxalase family protein